MYIFKPAIRYRAVKSHEERRCYILGPTRSHIYHRVCSVIWQIQDSQGQIMPLAPAAPNSREIHDPCHSVHL